MSNNDIRKLANKYIHIRCCGLRVHYHGIAVYIGEVDKAKLVYEEHTGDNTPPIAPDADPVAWTREPVFSEDAAPVSGVLRQALLLAPEEHKVITAMRRGQAAGDSLRICGSPQVRELLTYADTTMNAAAALHNHIGADDFFTGTGINTTAKQLSQQLTAEARFYYLLVAGIYAAGDAFNQ